MQCGDGGYDRYPSRLTSCQARSVAFDVFARVGSLLLTGMCAIFWVVFPEYIFALEEKLTWSNWPSMASPCVTASILLAGVAVLGSFGLFAAAIMPFDHALFSPRRLGVLIYSAMLIVVVALLGSVVLLAVEFGSRKIRKWDQARKEEEKEKREAEKETRKQKKDGECTFWFVKAWYIKAADGPLPAFQDLRKIAPEDALTQVTISRRNAFGGHGQNKYGGHLAISHRWETGRTPDAKGVQMKKIQDYLTDHEDIDLVWCDFW